ncbi:uncharacterized protein LOC112596003 [Melanaphis sacchari]|uniref:uncharacterized protein LOC112596003 n=1 Tax=Melanaphis sacchari TaxID=742174 RepID=UPI000DC148F7|nr:uncharacterized protein LOC112596003 [Melanaphis sacchari]
MMKIRFNLVISAIIAIVFVVSLVNAKNILQNPVADNQSKSKKPSVKQSSDIHLPISHIDAVEKSMTDDTTNTTLDMPPSNTTAKTFVKETVNNDTTNSTSIEDTTILQATTITSVEMVTENQTSTNQTTESGLLTTRYVINPSVFTESTKCPSGQTENSNGGCSPIF